MTDEPHVVLLASCYYFLSLFSLHEGFDNEI